MKHRGLLLLALLVFLVTPAVAAPCTPGNLDGYTAGNFSCTFDVFTLKNIDFSITDVGALTGRTPFGEVFLLRDFDVTPPLALGGALGIGSKKFAVGEDQHVRFILSYLIDPPPPIIPGFEFEMFAESPIFPGKATITTDLCPGGTFGGTKGCIAFDGSQFDVLTLTVFHTGKGVCDKCLDSVIFDTPVNFLSVRHTIDLDGGPKGGGGSSQIDGFRAVIGIPEPSGILLAGIGLLGVGLLRRCRAKLL